MIPKSKVQAMAKIMTEFDERLYELQKEYKKRIREITKKADKEKLEKIRKNLRS